MQLVLFFQIASSIMDSYSYPKGRIILSNTDVTFTKRFKNSG